MRWIFIIICSFSCTDLLIQDSSYHSIFIENGAWLEIHPDESYNDTTEFTFQMWFTGGSVDLDTSPSLFSILDDDGSIEFGLFVNPDQSNMLSIWVENELSAEIELDFDILDPDEFHQITIQSSDQLEIMFDGLIVFTHSFALNPLTDNILIIGGKVSPDHGIRDNFWTGHIDEIRIWSTLLDDVTLAFHLENPEKLSPEISDDFPYLYTLNGFWRFESDGDYFTQFEDESCQMLKIAYPDRDCNISNLNYVFTTGNGQVTLSENQY